MILALASGAFLGVSCGLAPGPLLALVLTQTLRHGPLVELRLNRPPVNALDIELLDDLLDALAGAVESGARGIVLSGQPGMFSAGLDIVRAIELDAHGMRGLCSVFFGVLQQVASSPVPVAAALTGYTAAGGAVIANLADYRVLAAGEGRIGFNESAGQSRLLSVRQAAIDDGRIDVDGRREFNWFIGCIVIINCGSWRSETR